MYVASGGKRAQASTFITLNVLMVSVQAATRKTRLSFFWGQVNEPLRKFREALRLFEEACKRLAIDKPKLTANVSATLAEVHVIDKDFDEQMEELITGWTSEGEQKTNEVSQPSRC